MRASLSQLCVFHRRKRHALRYCHYSVPIFQINTGAITSVWPLGCSCIGAALSGNVHQVFRPSASAVRGTCTSLFYFQASAHRVRRFSALGVKKVQVPWRCGQVSLFCTFAARAQKSCELRDVVQAMWNISPCGLHPSLPLETHWSGNCWTCACVCARQFWQSLSCTVCEFVVLLCSRDRAYYDELLYSGSVIGF